MSCDVRGRYFGTRHLGKLRDPFSVLILRCRAQRLRHHSSLPKEYPRSTGTRSIMSTKRQKS